MSISVCYSINAYNDSVLYRFDLCFVEDHDACILKVTLDMDLIYMYKTIFYLK